MKLRQIKSAFVVGSLDVWIFFIATNVFLFNRKCYPDPTAFKAYIVSSLEMLFIPRAFGFLWRRGKQYWFAERVKPAYMGKQLRQDHWNALQFPNFSERPRSATSNISNRNYSAKRCRHWWPSIVWFRASKFNWWILVCCGIERICGNLA